MSVYRGHVEGARRALPYQMIMRVLRFRATAMFNMQSLEFRPISLVDELYGVTFFGGSHPSITVEANVGQVDQLNILPICCLSQVAEDLVTKASEVFSRAYSHEWGLISFGFNPSRWNDRMGFIPCVFLPKTAPPSHHPSLHIVLH